MKGSIRKNTARDREIRQLAARIPDAEALDAIAAAVPPGQRAGFIRAITPLLKFKPAA